MSTKHRSRKLTADGELTEYQVKVLSDKQHSRTQEVLAAEEFPPPDHPDLEYTDSPGDFIHPAAQRARKAKVRGKH